MPSYYLFTQHLCVEVVHVLVWGEKELWSQRRSKAALVAFFFL